MKKRILIVLLLLVCMVPINVLAVSKDYEDNVASVVGITPDTNKVTLYLFFGQECPHCEEERIWLKKIEKDYRKYLDVKYYEVWHDDTNRTNMEKIREQMDIERTGVPLTVIGDKYYVGYSTTMSSVIENTIKEYAELDHNPNQIKLPILGTVNIQEVSIPLVAVILGFIDGFNPCAMWVLLFLINLLFGMENKKGGANKNC